MNKGYIFLLLISKILYANSFKIEPLYKILPLHPEIQYIKCQEAEPFYRQPFPFAKFPQLQPHEGLMAETFILKIPNGEVFSNHGWIKVDDYIIEDCISPYFSIGHHYELIKCKFPKDEPIHISGKVAVITMVWDECYAHWMYHILSRLALLELYNISYDYIYVASDKPFMKETLALWGIDPDKILSPFSQKSKYIRADELIVPSHIGTMAPMPHQYPLNWIPLKEYCKVWNLDPDVIKIIPSFLNPEIDTPLPENVSIHDYFLRDKPLCGIYFLPWAVEYIRNKFLPFVQSKEYNFSNKIFISRADGSIRKMLNEDEVFHLFEPLGFKRYVLSKLSVLEQIALFHGADIIIGAHGSAMANLMFCKRNTKVYEIFQGRSDCAFCYLSQILDLDYHPIKTIEFENISGLEHTAVPLDTIQTIIEALKNGQ